MAAWKHHAAAGREHITGACVVAGSRDHIKQPQGSFHAVVGREPRRVQLH